MSRYTQAFTLFVEKHKYRHTEHDVEHPFGIKGNDDQSVRKRKEKLIELWEIESQSEPGGQGPDVQEADVSDKGGRRREDAGGL